MRATYASRHCALVKAPATQPCRFHTGCSLRGVPYAPTIARPDDCALFSVLLVVGPGEDTACGSGCRPDGVRQRTFWPDEDRGSPHRDPGGRVPGHAAPGPGRRLRAVPRRPLGRRSPGSGRASGTSSASSSPGRAGPFTAEGKTFKGVGLRYSGNASYMASAGGLKRSFLVDLDRADHADFHGLHAMQLQSGALDPDEGARGPRLRPLPRGRRARAPHGPGRGDAHRPRRA